MKRDAIRDAGLRELGAHARLRKIAYGDDGSPRPFPERRKLLSSYKAELKTLHREIALECHPDRNMDASEEVRSERSQRFNRVTRAVNFLMDLEPQQPRSRVVSNQPAIPMRQGFAVIINMGPRGMGINDLRYGSGVADQTTTSTGHWPWHG